MSRRLSVLSLLVAALTLPADAAETPPTRGTEGTQPLSALDSLNALRTKPRLTVQLVAAEPLIASPVAIDWGADGRLWVCEMFDYPTGLDEKWQPGGRVKVLRDTNGDGQLDHATIFLDGLPFPTGVTAYRNGALVCAAPDILYAEDTDGDGKADKVEKLLSGFHTDNYQARVNSLSLGLDNWIYGANGLLGGEIRGLAGGAVVNIRNRDFRFKPGTEAFEPVSGLTQQSRVRDDWGNWFGCDNSRPLLHYPLPDHYLRRNPYVPAVPPTVVVPRYSGAGRLYPISTVLERFNDPNSANHVTSGCGLGIYRDTLLGDAYYGDAFVCEPVHNLVHREKLTPQGLTFSSRRAEGEERSEFLASTDPWFRPVQARTGPDGALYVVDMYRFLIEHPRWIQAPRLAKIDVRAGANLGRIYRVVPEGVALRKVGDLTKLNASELALALDSPNGTERDRVHLELLRRQDGGAADALRKVASNSPAAAARVQSLCALEGLGVLRSTDVVSALQSKDPRIRQQAVRLAEPFLRAENEQPIIGRNHPTPVFDEIMRLALENDPNPGVVAQLAFSLGETTNLIAGIHLGQLAQKHIQRDASPIPGPPDDPYFRAAVLSSAKPHALAMLQVMEKNPESWSREWIEPLVRMQVSGGDPALGLALVTAFPSQNSTHWSFAVLSGLFAELEARQLDLDDILHRLPLQDVKPRILATLAQARRLAGQTNAAPNERVRAIGLLGHTEATATNDIQFLCSLVRGPDPEPIRKAAISALRRPRLGGVDVQLTADWTHLPLKRRGEVLALLLTRDEWIASLMTLAASGQWQPNELPLADRERLSRSSNPRIQEWARQTFSSPPRRSEALAKFESALQLSGEPKRGSESFTKVCATCHALHGQGHAVGPDLAPLRSKDAAYWLKNILDPNAAIEPRYVNYQVETKDGRSLTGVISAETSASFTLLSPGGVTETVARDAFVDLRASALSLMPEGLEEGMTPQAMADLIAFLRAGGG